jgi:hypothetical protein
VALVTVSFVVPRPNLWSQLIPTLLVALPVAVYFVCFFLTILGSMGRRSTLATRAATFFAVTLLPVLTWGVMGGLVILLRGPSYDPLQKLDMLTFVRGVTLLLFVVFYFILQFVINRIHALPR